MTKTHLCSSTARRMTSCSSPVQFWTKTPRSTTLGSLTGSESSCRKLLNADRVVRTQENANFLSHVLQMTDSAFLGHRRVDGNNGCTSACRHTIGTICLCRVPGNSCTFLKHNTLYTSKKSYADIN